MASAGALEGGSLPVARQTTHWRFAPLKSQPALLVAHIYVSLIRSRTLNILNYEFVSRA